MKIITAKPMKIDFDKVKKVQPEQFEKGKVVDEDLVIYVAGKPVLAYTHVPKDLLEGMRSVVKSTKYTVNHRAGGLPTKSSVFGALPRVAIRCDYCRITRATRDEPENHAQIVAFREYVDGFYKRFFPVEFERAVAEVASDINGDWRLGDSPFLTCNINVNFAIPYHRDTGNLTSALSNVTIVRDGIEGGELVLPEYGISLAQTDGALCFFQGQSIIHGVLPFKTLKPDAYRASIVYYTMAGMKNCLSKAGETARAQTTRTVKERMGKDERMAKLEKSLKSKAKA